LTTSRFGFLPCIFRETTRAVLPLASPCFSRETMTLTAAEIILQYVCPGLGVLIGNSMFGAPIRDCYRQVVKGQGLQTLNPTPWAFMLGNCFGWVTYSILIQDLFVFAGNAPGFLIAFWLNLQASKMQYETHRSQELRTAIIQELEDKDDATDTARLLVERTVPESKAVPAPHERLVLFNVLVWLAVTALISFAKEFSQETNEWIVGITVNLNLLVFYAAPLSTIWTVLSTRSAASIHVPTMLTNTFNGCFWGAYGISVLDWFIAVPNVLGAGLGMVQIVLCFLFPRTALPRRAPTTTADVEAAAKEESSSMEESNHTATEEPR